MIHRGEVIPHLILQPLLLLAGSIHASCLPSLPCLSSQACPEEGRALPPQHSNSYHFHLLSKQQTWYKFLYVKTHVSFTESLGGPIYCSQEEENEVREHEEPHTRSN